ncbi:MAG: hypothetical protein U0572_16990 [Phycisphaerales bacterium]
MSMLVVPGVSGFESNAMRLMQAVRSALATLLEAVRTDATRPQHMSRQFGLNKNLTWKLSKILSDPAPETFVRHLPGRPGLAIFLRTMQQASAPAAELAAFSRAIDEYETYVRETAGDREKFGAMLAGLDGGEAQREEDSRKLSFQGNCATWGVQTRLHLSVHVALPSKVKDRVDLVVVSGFVDFHRLRADVSWPLALARTGSDSGGVAAPGAFEPLDPLVAPDELPILHAFSSEPAPHLRTSAATGGGMRYEICEGPIGRMNAVSCLIGRVSKAAVSPWSSESERWGEHVVSLTTPTELLVHDVFVHRDLPLAREPESAAPTARLYNQLPGFVNYPAGSRDQGLLPLSEPIVALGSPPDLALPEYPRYGELIEHICARAACAVGDLAGFRLRLRYPPMPALAVLRYPLARPPR